MQLFPLSLSVFFVSSYVRLSPILVSLSRPVAVIASCCCCCCMGVSGILTGGQVMSLALYSAIVGSSLQGCATAWSDVSCSIAATSEMLQLLLAAPPPLWPRRSTTRLRPAASKGPCCSSKQQQQQQQQQQEQPQQLVPSAGVSPLSLETSGSPTRKETASGPSKASP